MKSDKTKLKNTLFVISIMGLIIFHEYSITWDPNFFVEKNKENILTTIPGTIELRVSLGEKALIYSLKNGHFLKESLVSIPPDFYEKRGYNYWFMQEKQVKGPDISGYHYQGHYKFNNDKSLAVFSLSPKKSEDVPNSLLLVNWQTKENILQINPDKTIEDIIWSPDSKMFAVLESSYGVPPISILGILSSCAGHPTSAHTYYLSIYDYKGNFIVNSKIGKRIMIPGGQLFWK